MTLAIYDGRRGKMFADKRVTRDTEVTSNEAVKIHQVGKVFIAAAGLMSSIQKTIHGCNNLELTISEFVGKMHGKDAEYLFYDTCERVVYYVGSGGYYYDITDKTHCIGSAEDFAKGWIEGKGKKDWSAKELYSYVSKHLVCVSNDFMEVDL